MIPVSFDTIEAGRHHKLYYRVNSYQNDVITIPDGNYTTGSLNNAIVDLLNLFCPLSSSRAPVETILLSRAYPQIHSYLDTLL